MDFLRLFPDGIHCIQNLSGLLQPDPSSVPDDPEEAKKRRALELRRIKNQKRQEASERAKKKGVAWREELARIEAEQKKGGQAKPVDHDIATVATQSTDQPTLQGDDAPTGDITDDDLSPASGSAHNPPSIVARPAVQPRRDTPPDVAGAAMHPYRYTPPAPGDIAVQRPRDDIQRRIRQYQDRRLLEEKERDERIAKGKARRDEQLVAEARAAWEKVRLTHEQKNNVMRLAAEADARAQAVRNAAIAVNDIRMVQQQAEKAAAERETARLEMEKAHQEQVAQEQAEDQARRQQQEEIARRVREQDQTMKEQAALEQARRNWAMEQILSAQRDQAERERPQREQVERLQRERQQEQARRDKQAQEYAIEEDRRQQAQSAQLQAQRKLAQREQAEEQARQQYQAALEQRQREQTQQQLALERAQREKAEEAKRRLEMLQAQTQERLALERAQREQAEEQVRQELIKAQEQLAREKAQREQAEEQRRRADLAAAQAREQLAHEKAQREQAEERRKREPAQAQAQAQAQVQEQNLQAKAEELVRQQAEQMQQERVAQEAINARTSFFAQNALAAEALLSRSQSTQSRNSCGEYQSPCSQYQENPMQNISIPQSSDILSASGAEPFNGQRSAPVGQQSGQLVNSNVMMELQSATIAVQSQIIATQSKLYSLQSELNGPDRSIVKHVQHNLLTEQLQSMVNMYNRIQMQIAGRQQQQSQTQTSEPAPCVQGPTFSKQQPRPNPQYVPNQRPQVVRPPFQPQQSFTAAPFASAQRPTQPPFRPQMRPKSQSPVTAGVSPDGAGMNLPSQANLPPQANLPQPQATNLNGFASSFSTRQSSVNPRPLQSQSSGQPSHPRPGQQSFSLRDTAIRAQQVRSQIRPNVLAPTSWASLPSLPNEGQPQVVTQTSGAADSQLKLPFSIPSSSQLQSKSPPISEGVRNINATQAVQREPSVSDVPSVQSRVQEQLESRSLAAKAQLLNAHHQERTRSAQTTKPQMEMGRLAPAMSVEGIQSMQVTGNGRSVLDMRLKSTALVPAQRSISATFDPFVPSAMMPSSILLGDVHDIVPLPVDQTEDVAARFTEIPESPSGKSSAHTLPDTSQRALPSSQVPVQANSRLPSSSRVDSPSVAPIVVQKRLPSSSRVDGPSVAPIVVQKRTTSVPTRQAGSPAIQARPAQLLSPTSQVESRHVTVPQETRPPEVAWDAAVPADTTRPSGPAENPVPPPVPVVTKEPSVQSCTAPMAIESPGKTVDTSQVNKEITPSQVIDNGASRTRQRSDSVEGQVGQRPAKRRRTDQVRWLESPSNFRLRLLPFRSRSLDSYRHVKMRRPLRTERRTSTSTSTSHTKMNSAEQTNRPGRRCLIRRILMPNSKPRLQLRLPP